MKKTLLFIFIFLAFISVEAQITLNQVDDFEDGTTQNWRIGSAASAAQMPMNIADGGPNGAGDNFLQYTSTGTSGAASKMIFYSQNNQWSGNFTAQGVDQITLNVKVETNDLDLRVAFQGNGSNRICSTTAIPVTAGSGWTQITFPITASDFTQVQGSGSIASVLADVSVMRIMSSASPTWVDADVISAVIQVDNITASSTLSTDEFQQTEEFVISPNPAKNKLNIRLPNSDSDLQLEVFDVLGKRVYKGTITKLESSVNVSNWKSGVYLVRISDDRSTQTKRFIKQ